MESDTPSDELAWCWFCEVWTPSYWHSICAHDDECADRKKLEVPNYSPAPNWWL